MKFLNHILLKLTEYQTLLEKVENNLLPVGVTGLSGIHKAHLIYALCANKNKRAFVFVSEESEAQKLANDISSMGLKPLVYPARDFNFRDVESQSREYEHERLQILLQILNKDCDVVIACPDAALQYTVTPSALKKKIITLHKMDTVKLSDIASILVSCGYEKYEQVDGIGQFAQRGGILDFFPPDAEAPVRAEFFGDEIDTLSYFDPETQRRTDSIDKITISPSTETFIDQPIALSEKIEQLAASLKGKSADLSRPILQKEASLLQSGILPSSIDKFIPLLDENPCTLFDYIEKDDFLFLSEPAKIKDRMRSILWQWNEDLNGYLEDGVLCPGLDAYAKDWIYFEKQLNKHPLLYLDTFAHSMYDVPITAQIHFNVRQLSVWNGSVSLLLEDIRASFTANTSLVILAGTKRSALTLTEDLSANGLPAEFREETDTLSPGKIIVLPGSLSFGMEYGTIPFALITHGHIASTRVKKKKKKKKDGQEIYNLSELSPGDYIVHSAHGIGMFEGIHKMSMQGITKDYIKVRYAKGDTLYVPVTQLDMVSKYIGPREDAHIRLHRLGGTEWQKTKKRVRAAVKDIAKELTRLYSQRMQAKGHAFSPDNEWQRDFEAHFEYEETADQLTCISEIKADMEKEAPMDRLLCGDVGFGKTEVALRAAFKCVTDSKQCALLVPTTILALQHYQTVCKRFEGFPIRVELLSRFRTPKQQTEILKRLERGEIDLIIGTHRLVQKDVNFRDLGLVIIDEEQRFGVQQKERFKELCKNVDILTLSATPIPRTLNMAMSGIRDMSTLEEAPQDRHPVQTYVLEYDPVVIAEAIRKELRRGGQVYYLHNKVESIERIATSLQMQIPEAKVGFGHGKMTEPELSEVWRKMLDQEINVLVCTTIIETGVDLPNVNTLIIENADHMGLSQLYQIRGRVGRSSRRAYAYLTFRKSKVLSEISQKRLSAIREFTEFGSGFKIAMRDLELRGAGNILGAQQHGHMEDVGYELYLRMLGEAVNEEKGKTTENFELECLVDVHVEAHIPEHYIESLNQRLDIYRRISDIRTSEDASDVLDELIDRFGDPPYSVKGLIDVALIRNTAASLGIYEIKQQNNALNLYQHKINMQQVSALLRTCRYKIMVNAGAKPYLSIKISEKVNPLTILREVLDTASLDQTKNRCSDRQNN